MLKFKLKRINKRNLLKKSLIIILCLVSLISIYRMYAVRVDASSYSGSEIIGNTVYINDLDADWYYYLGLNYTNITGEDLPTGESQNLYGENNLAPVAITYDSTDPALGISGKVSPLRTENQTKFIYYKYYPIVNGEIVIELPDNLFTLRPLGYGFGGWKTSYNGAKIKFDKDIYTWFAYVPAPNANLIEITFNPVWQIADYQLSNSGSIDNFSERTMKRIAEPILGTAADMQPGVTYDFDFDPNKEYFVQDYASYYGDGEPGWYPDGNSYSQRNSCNSFWGCDYYHLTHDEHYNPNNTYYKRVQNGNRVSFAQINNNDLAPIIGFTPFTDGKNMIGYYYKEDVGTNDSSLYYDSVGQSCNRTNCRAGNTYKLLNNSDPESIYHLNTNDSGNYYYLVTRDLNIFVLMGNNDFDFSNLNSIKPFTVTSSNQSAGSRNTGIYDDSAIYTGGSYVTLSEDLAIENVYISNNMPATIRVNTGNWNYEYIPYNNAAYETVNSDYSIYANGKNLKMGRNIYNVDDNKKDFHGIYGGNNSRALGTSSKYVRFKLIVESGRYNHIISTGGSSNDHFIHSLMYLGNDYDRADEENNENLYVLFTTAASFYGSLKTDDIKNPSVKTVVKSGSFGKTLGNAYDTDYSHGIYVGSRGSSNTNDTSVREVYVQGGDINVMNGGPCVSQTMTNKNVIKMNVVGGTIRSIFGGAGLTATYGNRIIQITGGKVKNNVFGGSNGSAATSGTDGTLYGHTLLYFGGNAKVGEENSTDTLFGASAGDVFGAGAGKPAGAGEEADKYREVGTIASTHMILNDDATIYGNFYGGGNYGTTGRATATTFTTTVLDLIDGTVKKNVFGSSNNNGSGRKSEITSTALASVRYFEGRRYYNNNQTMHLTTTFTYNGVSHTYDNYQFDGTKVQFGDRCNSSSPSWNAQSNRCVIAYQTIEPGEPLDKYTANDCDGGYCPHFTRNLLNVEYEDMNWHLLYEPQVSYGSEAHSITINQNGSTVEKNIYGGANSGGTVFASVYINLLSGDVGDSVFAGGRGAATYVSADMNVNINGLDDEGVKVYGGSEFGVIGFTPEDNASNSLIRNVQVTMTSGNIGTIFGGSMGDNTPGAEVIPLVASKVKVDMNGGTVANIYGGHNLNGTYNNTAIVNLNGGTVTNSVFGGSNEVGSTVPTVVNLKGSTATNVFGGSNKSGQTNNNYVNVTAGTATNVYGGNNEGGSAVSTNVVLEGGKVTNTYGCGKGSGTTCTNTKVWIKGLNDFNAYIYGGGESASVTGSTSVLFQNGLVHTIFGGSNTEGTVNRSKVFLTGGTATNAFGGNNVAGSVTNPLVLVGGSNVQNVYGGGDHADETITRVFVYSGTVNNVFGGGHAANVGTSYVEVYGGRVTNAYGGSNESGDVLESNVNIRNENSLPTKSKNFDKHVAINKNTTPTLDLTTIFTELVDEEDPISWTSSNTSAATVTNNTVSAVADGLSVITATVNHKNYRVILDVIDSDSGDSGSSGGTGGGEFTSDYEYPNLSASFTIENGSTNSWQCRSDDCKKYIYAMDIKMNVNNPYSERIVNYNLLLINNSDFYVTKDSANNAYYPKTEWNYLRSNVWKTTGYYYSMQSYCDQSINCQIPLNPGDNDLGKIRVYFNDRDFDFRLAFEEMVDPSTLAPTNNTTPANTTNEIFLYSRTMYDEPTYSAAARNLTNVYGGNNTGGLTQETHVNILDNAVINKVYGGGNRAASDYTNVYLESGTIESLYGAGDGAPAVVNHNSNTIITGGTINNSAYGGGNLAPVIGGSEISLLGGTIHGSLFAAGNNAVTGTEASNNAVTTVNVIGGVIDKNVYGGANTSVVYGETYVNIGQNVVTNSELEDYVVTSKNISIGKTETVDGEDVIVGGTIFGGGEANDSGSPEYDFDFISVTVGTNVNIDGTGYHDTGTSMTIKGSFFGSGNASETSGYSNMLIRNYGDSDIPAKNISIQRAGTVKIYNSHIELAGATDRTNDYATTLFSINIVENFYMLDNTSIYVQNGSNLLESIYSGKYENDEFVKESASIVDGVVTTNGVNNKLYIMQFQNINVAHDQGVSDYGDVVGMAYLGLYKPNKNGTMNLGVYDDSYGHGDTADATDITAFAGGAYVLGKHYRNSNNISIHDITVDGYYSHFVDDGSDVVRVDYVNPIPEDGNQYMWIVGLDIATFNVDMIASKFSTMGTSELQLLRFGKPNTRFEVTGFSYEGLDTDIVFGNKNDIPKVAASEADADVNFALSMSTSNTGWANNATANFHTYDPNVGGNTVFLSDNTNDIPSLAFYLYHSKNIGTKGNIGSVDISMIAITPLTPITNEIKRINITVNITRSVETKIAYDSSITSGKKYSIFPTSTVNITNKSALSAYYTLFAVQKPEDQPIYKRTYYRALYSTGVLPVGTTITMLDIVENEYYYYTVTDTNIVAKQQEFATQRQASYYLRDFIKMDSTSPSNNYSDIMMNTHYYHDNGEYEYPYADEEFIFIVDFANTHMTENIIDASLILEMRTEDDQTKYTVVPSEYNSMVYSVYANTDASIVTTSSFTKDTVYVGESTELDLHSVYQSRQIEGTDKRIIDTQFLDYKLGAKISVYNEEGNKLDGSSLLGVTFTLNGVNYFPQTDGTTRITLADKVSNVDSAIIVNTANSNLSNGTYTFRIESFGSYDGLYYGEAQTTKNDITLNVLNNLYGLDVSSPDVSVTRNKDTGLDENGNDEIKYDIKVSTGIDNNPNLRVHLERRRYGDGNEYSMLYDLVDLQDYVTDELVVANSERHEYKVLDPIVQDLDPVTNKPIPKDLDFTIHIGEELMTGTYRLVFTVCDGDNHIGDVYQYIIIR